MFGKGIEFYQNVLYRWREPLISVLASLAFWFAWKEKRLARKQLRTFLGTTPSQATDIVRNLCRHLARSLVETLDLTFRPDEVLRTVQWSEGSREAFSEALKRRRGIVLASGHIGNWELLSAVIARTFSPTATFYKASYDPGIDRLIVSSREIHGMRCIARDDELRDEKTQEILDQNGIVAVLIDQSTRVSSVAVPFFSAPAFTPIGAAVLAARYKSPMVVCWIERTERGHLVHASPALEARAVTKEEYRRLTCKATQTLELAIRKRPEQWVWFHARWKK